MKKTMTLNATTISKSQIITALAVCLGLTLTVCPARSQGVLVDKIVAVVEDDAIFQSDVDQTVKQLMLVRGEAGLAGTNRTQLEKEALTELINNKLVIAKANSLGISVSFSEVEKAVDRAIEENKNSLGGEQAFNRQLEAEGLTLESLKKIYREQIQNRMLVERVLASQVDRASIKITEDDLREAYEARQGDLPTRPDVVHLATIFIGMESSESAKTKAKAEIDELQRRILAGEDFAGIAKEYSEDPSAELGGSLGRLKLTDLSNPEFVEAAASLSVGEVSDPVLTPFGYHLIQITGADSTTGEVELRHILIRLKAEERHIQDIFQLAEEVHALLVAGAPFDSVAAEHSTDTATAAEGGDLGWLRASELPEFFQEVLKEMGEGDISPVLREPAGFRIVKLIERESARPYTFEEVRDQLEQLLQQEKLAEMYDEYLGTLQSEFYVQVREQ